MKIVPRRRVPEVVAPICPFDVSGIAGCVFNEPTAPAVSHRSRVGCRWFSVEAVDGAPRGVCRHPQAPVLTTSL